MTSSNFEHLQEFDKALATLGQHAERYFVDDANTALVKTRQFAERLSFFVSSRAGIELEDRSDFIEVLRQLRNQCVVPRDVLDVLHQLRKTSNLAVHSLEWERREAFDAIRLCHRLGVWLRASLTRQPKLTMAFVPPKPAVDETKALRSDIEGYKEQLAAANKAVADAMARAQAAQAAAISADERARLAEEEREIMEQLAEEAEARTTVPPDATETKEFIRAATVAGQAIDLDEPDTRVLVDQQLRMAGWEADTKALRHGNGTRPEKGRNMAIAEWPTANGPADYALFIGERMVGLIEAKR